MTDHTNPTPDRAGAGWRDRLFGWRAVAATTLASVILGSAGGAALAAAADGTGQDRGGFPGRGQVPGGQLPGLPQGQTPPPGAPDQSATLPRTDDEEA